MERNSRVFRNKCTAAEELTNVLTVLGICVFVTNVVQDEDFEGLSLPDLICSWDANFQIPRTVTPIPRVSWIPLPHGVLRLNFDGSFLIDT